MAIGAVFNAPGVSQAQYQQVRREVIPGDVLPAGMLSHLAGPTQDGWMVVEVWESQQQLDNFFQQTLGAALNRAGISGQPIIFEVFAKLGS
jgi:hypothetical protein